MEAKLRVGRVWRAPAEEILPVSTSAAFFEAGADTIEPAFEGICGWTPFQPVCIDRRHPNEIGAVGQRCEVCLRRLRHQLVDDIDKAGINAERSEERRVGKEGVSPCRYRWSPYH